MSGAVVVNGAGAVLSKLFCVTNTAPWTRRTRPAPGTSIASMIWSSIA
jgi:hypothetical protein